MRELADAERIRRFLSALGAAADTEGAAYLTGGATAVLLGWRSSTIDVDLALRPETDALLRAIATLKDDLRINVELVSPADFIPVPSGWEDRSVFAAREGKLTIYHFDPYAQALAKLERAHDQDLRDVESLIEAGLVDPDRARRYFEEVEAQLFRFPAIDPPSFRARVEAAFGGAS